MKEKLPTKHTDKSLLKKAPVAALFYFIVIILSAAAIVFFSLSVYNKIEAHFLEEEEDIEQQHLKVIQIEVLNGCGTPGIADRFTDYLRDNNFDVVQMGNYISFDIDNSIVIDRTGELEKAYAVAEAMGIDRKFVISQINKNYFIDVTLIIGKDFNQLIPNK